MGSGPMKIKKQFPWGWIGLAALGVGAGIAIFAVKHAPLSLAISRPVAFKVGERDPVLTASGYLVARHRATVSAKVPGRVAWLGVEEGNRVTKGQIIARLEDADTQAARDQTFVNLQQAEADLARGEALAREGILDRANLDHLRTGAATYRAQLRYQDAVLENMVLRAPFTGTVTQKLSEVGETVSPGSAGGANAINAVAILADFESLELEVEVNETGIVKLRKGMPAEIKVDALEAEPGAKPLRGELREIDRRFIARSLGIARFEPDLYQSYISMVCTSRGCHHGCWIYNRWFLSRNRRLRCFYRKTRWRGICIWVRAWGSCICRRIPDVRKNLFC